MITIKILHFNSALRCVDNPRISWFQSELCFEIRLWIIDFQFIEFSSALKVVSFLQRIEPLLIVDTLALIIFSSILMKKRLHSTVTNKWRYLEPSRKVATQTRHISSVVTGLIILTPVQRVSLNYQVFFNPQRVRIFICKNLPLTHFNPRNYSLISTERSFIGYD